MKNKIYIFLLLFFYLISYSQDTQEEFTGLIKFNHKVIPKQKDYDVNNDYSAIGKTSDYYFKDGNIKWLTYDSYFKVDLFIAKENRDYYITSKSDTIFTIKNNVKDFDIVDYKITKSDETILGHKCWVLQLQLKSLNADSPITYRRYYFSSDFYIDSTKLVNCTSNGYDFIYSQMKSIPLKIEYEFANRIIVWEASEIKAMKLEDHFFELEMDSIVAYW